MQAADRLSGYSGTKTADKVMINHQTCRNGKFL